MLSWAQRGVAGRGGPWCREKNNLNTLKIMKMGEYGKPICVAGAVLAAVISGMRAAPIAWQPVGGVADDSAGEEVLNTGTYAIAWNANGTGTTPGDLTVNGVLFKEDEQIAGPGGVSINAGVGGSWTSAGAIGMAASANWTGNFRTVLDSAVGTLAGVTAGFRIEGLTPGVEYRVQIFLHHETAGGNPREVCDAENPSNCTPPVDHLTLSADNVVGTFVADATTFQNVVFKAAIGRAVLNAVSVFETPAPATIYGIKSRSLGPSGPYQYETPAILYRYPDRGGAPVNLGTIRTAGGTELRADGLAYWPELGLWFFEPSGADDPAGSILRPLDPATAVAGEGFSLPGRDVFGAAFDLSGNLWAIDEESDELIRVNTADGQVLEAIGLELDGIPFDLGFGGGDIAFNSSGRLWLVYEDTFYEVDPATGVMTYLYAYGGISLYIVGAAFSPEYPANVHVFDVSIGWNNDDLLLFDTDDNFNRTDIALRIFDSLFNAGRGDLAAVTASAVPPPLSIRRSGSDLILSWPQFPGGWILQESSTLGTQPDPWTDIPPPYTTDGADFSHSTAIPADKDFYRLSK